MISQKQDKIAELGLKQAIEAEDRLIWAITYVRCTRCRLNCDPRIGSPLLVETSDGISHRSVCAVKFSNVSTEIQILKFSARTKG